jgi:hypothetical protein
VQDDHDSKVGRGAGERQGRWSRVPGPPLTEAQERALIAIVDLCPELGSEATLKPISDRAGLPPGPAMLALKGLERRRMVWKHDEDGDDEPTWTPTGPGRDHAQAVRAKT